MSDKNDMIYKLCSLPTMLLQARLLFFTLLGLVGGCSGAGIRAGQFLSVQGDRFMYRGQQVSTQHLSRSHLSIYLVHVQVYLSGTNTAWVHYGSDFGDNAWEHHGDM